MQQPIIHNIRACVPSERFLDSCCCSCTYTPSFHRPSKVKDQFDSRWYYTINSSKRRKTKLTNWLMLRMDDLKMANSTHFGCRRNKYHCCRRWRSRVYAGYRLPLPADSALYVLRIWEAEAWLRFCCAMTLRPCRCTCVWVCARVFVYARAFESTHTHDPHSFMLRRWTSSTPTCASTHTRRPLTRRLEHDR